MNRAGARGRELSQKATLESGQHRVGVTATLRTDEPTQGPCSGLDDLDTDGSLGDKSYGENIKAEEKELANENKKHPKAYWESVKNGRQKELSKERTRSQKPQRWGEKPGSLLPFLAGYLTILTQVSGVISTHVQPVIFGPHTSLYLRTQLNTFVDCKSFGS